MRRGILSEQIQHFPAEKLLIIRLTRPDERRRRLRSAASQEMT